MEIALTKTLANKFRTTVPKIYRKYGGKRTMDGYTYKVLVVELPTKNGTRYIYWAYPLKVIKPGVSRLMTIWDTEFCASVHRTILIQRLQANECEICGAARTFRSPSYSETGRPKEPLAGRK